MFSDGVLEFIYEKGLTKASRKLCRRRIMHARMKISKSVYELYGHEVGLSSFLCSICFISGLLGNSEMKRGLNYEQIEYLNMSSLTSNHLYSSQDSINILLSIRSNSSDVN